jgi:guanylate kinase
LKLILFCGASGSGKTSIVHHLLANNSRLCFSVSATTRPKRGNETEGEDYYFLSEEEFKLKIKHDEFLEWEEVYPGRYYGTLKSEIRRINNNHQIAVFDVDVEGGLKIKRYFEEHLLAIFVMPPDLNTLRERLLRRGSETTESLERRVTKAEAEFAYASKFDHVIINDTLEEACRKAQGLLDEFLMAVK